MSYAEPFNLHLESVSPRLRGQELQHGAVRFHHAHRDQRIRAEVRQWHDTVRTPSRTLWRYQDMQPNHINLGHALVRAEQSGVAGLDDQRPDRDQRWMLLVESME